jgi:cytochrome c oxidase cbb3-type subunit 4
MKIVMHSLQQIAHIEIIATIGFLIFFIFFLWMGYSVFKTPKSYVEEMSHLPLEGQDEDFYADEDSK